MAGFPHRRGAENTEERGGLLLEAEDHAVDAVCHSRNVEVEEQTNLPATETQVGEELGLVNSSDVLHSFNLHDNLAGDQQIKAVRGIQLELLVPDGQMLLSFKRDTTQSQFVAQTFLVSRF